MVLFLLATASAHRVSEIHALCIDPLPPPLPYSEPTVFLSGTEPRLLA